MGFFDRLFSNKGVFNDHRNPDMVCELTLCNQKHILSEFDIAYEPGSHTKEYLEAYAVFSEPVNSEVENWITKGNRKESGMVRFYRNSDSLDEGALFEIRFSEASCIRYRNIVCDGLPIKTLVLALPSVKMGGEAYEIQKPI